jgi:peptide/nickel transport system substrate-binding protein
MEEEMRHARVVAVSLLAMLSVLLSSCGGATPTVAPATSEPMGIGPTAANVEPATERVLRVAATHLPAPDPTTGQSTVTFQVMLNLYDSLVFPNAKGGLDPCAAETWEASDGSQTWTFHLRKGIKFHHGGELTARDVLFSLDMLNTTGGGWAYAFGDVTEATAPDDYTVQFKLGAPDGLFDYRAMRLWVVSADEITANKKPGDYGEFGDFGKEYLATHDAGSGPYTVTDYKVGESITMERNPYWWGTYVPNAPDKVIFLPVMENVTQRTMMAAHELEITDPWHSADHYKNLDEVEGVEIAALNTGTMVLFMMNTQKPPTDDVHFRRAMEWAFDYDQAATLGWPGSKKATGPVASVIPGAATGLNMYYRDLDKAREELAKSKYADQLSDVKVTLEFAGDAHDERFPLLFQANMAEIGIQVELLRPPWVTVAEDMVSKEQGANLMDLGLQPDFPDAAELLYEKYHSDSMGSTRQTEWWGNAEFDKAIKAAMAISDPAERYAATVPLQQLVIDEALTIYVLETPQLHAYNASYVEWPAAEGSPIPVHGYELFAPIISVFPEKM